MHREKLFIVKAFERIDTSPTGKILGKMGNDGTSLASSNQSISTLSKGNSGEIILQSVR